jgi:hypothetical protein
MPPLLPPPSPASPARGRRFQACISTVCAEREVTVATVLWPLAEMEGLVATESVAVTLPGYCSGATADVRAASSKAKAHLRQFWGNVFEDVALFRVFSRLAELAPPLEEDESRLLARWLFFFLSL